jgi:hypothetical protein
MLFGILAILGGMLLTGAARTLESANAAQTQSLEEALR